MRQLPLVCLFRVSTRRSRGPAGRPRQVSARRSNLTCRRSAVPGRPVPSVAHIPLRPYPTSRIFSFVFVLPDSTTTSKRRVGRRQLDLPCSCLPTLTRSSPPLAPPTTAPPPSFSRPSLRTSAAPPSPSPATRHPFASLSPSSARRSKVSLGRRPSSRLATRGSLLSAPLPIGKAWARAAVPSPFRRPRALCTSPKSMARSRRRLARPRSARTSTCLASYRPTRTTASIASLAGGSAWTLRTFVTAMRITLTSTRWTTSLTAPSVSCGTTWRRCCRKCWSVATSFSRSRATGRSTSSIPTVALSRWRTCPSSTTSSASAGLPTPRPPQRLADRQSSASSASMHCGRCRPFAPELPAARCDRACLAFCYRSP
mmetsp:Transcript_5519/g.17892  ORF Transcript_5519/g.17892 Transcript_5519/m.17892 type:complete len:371 (+) Transcript_5519:259-1371(+)